MVMARRNSELVSELVQKAVPAERLRKSRRAVWLANLFMIRNKMRVEQRQNGTVGIAEDDDTIWKPIAYLPVNLALKIFLSKLSQLLAVPIQFVVDSGVSGELEDELSAAYAEKVLEAVVTPRLQKIREEFLFWCLVADRSLIKIIWDKQGGDLIEVPGAGKKREGDIKLVVLPPFSYLVDPYSRGKNVFEPDECDTPARWFQHERLAPLDYISETYGIPLKELRDRCQQFDYLNEIEREIARIRGVSGETGTSDLTKIIEHWELPSGKYPNGRLVTFIGNSDIVLQETELPQPWQRLRRLPVVDLCEIYDFSGYYGMTTVENIAPICKTFSEITSKVVDLSLNKVGTTTAFIQGSDKITKQPLGDDTADVMIRYNSAQPPQIVTYETFPFTLLRALDVLLGDLEMVSGTAEIKYPMRTRTATEIIKAEEADSSRIAIFKRNFTDAITRVGELCLEVIKEYYYPERKIEVVGQYGDIEVLLFDREKLNKKFNISVKSSGLFYSTRYAKLLFLQQLAPIMQVLLSDPESRGRWVKLMGDIVSGIMEVTFAEHGSEHSQQVRQAERENIIFLNTQGIRPPDAVIFNPTIDDHKIHIETHRKFLLSNYNRTDFHPAQKSYLKNHVEQHIAAMEVEQQRAMQILSLQNKQQNPIAGVATGTQQQVEGTATPEPNIPIEDLLNSYLGTGQQPEAEETGGVV